MSEPTAELTIDIDIIRNNITYLKSLLKPNTKFMAILKANAYGHGLKRITSSIDDIVDGYGLVRLDEAARVRKYTKKNILLMQGVYNNNDLDTAAKSKFDLVVHNSEQLFALDNLDINLWIKVNTGMNRLGFSPEEFFKIYNSKLINRKFTLMSHLACADNPSDDLNNKQFDLFHKISSSINTTNEKSIGNTGSIINFPDKDFDWVRSGIGIYGGFKGDNNLKPAMSFRSKIIEIRKLKQGDRVGYNGRVIANKAMTIAIVYAGYADGYPQSAIDTTQINVNNYLVNICGQVSMDLLSIDITQIPNCKIGDWCTFWDDNKSLEHTANQNNLISYELMTRITPRVKVIYKNS